MVNLCTLIFVFANVQIGTREYSLWFISEILIIIGVIIFQLVRSRAIYIQIDQLKEVFKHTLKVTSGFIEKRYYPDGNIKDIMIAERGRQIYTRYWENGQKQYEGYIYNALWWQVGKWEIWNEEGILVEEYYFNDSIPNMREGTWKWWDDNGNLVKEEEYQTDELIRQKVYDKNIEVKEPN